MTISKPWTMWAAMCAALALVLFLAGCPAVDTRDPVPDKATLPLTASWSSATADAAP